MDEPTLKQSNQLIPMKKLNLGCGNDIRTSNSDEIWVNLDSVGLKGVDVVHDLNLFPWPFLDNTFDVVIAQDIIEHLPDTIKVMEEIWRILKPSGELALLVPYWNSVEMITDPTHQRFFNEYTFEFFDIQSKRFKKRHYYTKARFEHLSLISKVTFMGVAFYLKEGFSQKFILWLSKRIGNITRNLAFQLRAVKDGNHKI